MNLSLPELLLLEERCIDGESRCEQRAEEACRRGDFAAAAFEAQLKEQYRRLRLKMRDRRDHDTRPAEAPSALLEERRREKSAQSTVAPRAEDAPG